MDEIYLNNHYSPRILPEVKDKISFYSGYRSMSDIFFKNKFSHELKQASQALYQLVSAHSDDPFIFTSSGAEAINHVIFSAYLDVTRKTGKNHFIASTLEEAPTLFAMKRLEKMGCLFEVVPADRHGKITVEAVEESISPRTALLSLSWANGLTGVIQPVAEIGKLCRQRGILFHVDASHVLGKGDYTFEASGADFLTFSGESLQGPSGTGGLFIRRGLEMSPLILGGNSQNGMRAGELSLGACIGLGFAAQHALSWREYTSLEVARLRNYFESLLIQQIPDTQVLFIDEERLPDITLPTFGGAASESLAFLLACKGLYFSIGGGHMQRLPSLLKECGISAPFCYTALSGAISRETREEELPKAVQKIVEGIHYLRKSAQSIWAEECL